MSSPTHPNKDRRPTVRRLVDLAILAAIAATAWLLWPASLGGHTRLIAVEGASMEPTYHLGDIVIARDNPNPQVGDVIVYHIPEGQPAAGLLIIHRITAVWPDGTYRTQGDNRTSPDPFHIASPDIVGTPVITLPRFGRFIGLASSPAVIGASSGLVATLMLWPTHGKNRRRKVHHTDKNGHHEKRLDQDRIDAEAGAWLDTELALVRSPGDTGASSGPLATAATLVKPMIGGPRGSTNTMSSRCDSSAIDGPASPCDLDPRFRRAVSTASSNDFGAMVSSLTSVGARPPGRRRPEAPRQPLLD